MLGRRQLLRLPQLVHLLSRQPQRFPEPREQCAGPLVQIGGRADLRVVELVQSREENPVETELAVVIGRRARHVGTEEALGETWGSVCHGAGRRMSRSKAKRTTTPKAVAAQLEARGIALDDEAREVFRDGKAWNELVLRAMKRDFSWKQQAKEYAGTYAATLKKRKVVT